MWEWVKSDVEWLTEKMKGWKTILFNVTSALMLAAPELLSFISAPEVKDAFPPRWQVWLLIINIIGNMLLRYYTTTPIGKKD